MKCISKITVVLIAVLLLTSCGSVPITGRRQLLLVPDSEVLAASLTQYDEYMKTAPKSTDRTKTAMVERVGRKIASATEEYLKQIGIDWPVQGFEKSQIIRLFAE